MSGSIGSGRFPSPDRLQAVDMACAVYPSNARHLGGDDGQGERSDDERVAYHGRGSSRRRARRPTCSIERLEQRALEITALGDREHFGMVERLATQCAERNAPAAVRGRALEHLEKE